MRPSMSKAPGPVERGPTLDEAGAHCKEVDRDHRSSLSTQELRPAQTTTCPARPEARVAKNLAHRRRRHGDPESCQLADDPLVAPPWILPCETDDEFPNVTSD